MLFFDFSWLVSCVARLTANMFLASSFQQTGIIQCFSVLFDLYYYNIYFFT